MLFMLIIIYISTSIFLTYTVQTCIFKIEIINRYLPLCDGSLLMSTLGEILSCGWLDITLWHCLSWELINSWAELLILSFCSCTSSIRCFARLMVTPIRNSETNKGSHISKINHDFRTRESHIEISQQLVLLYSVQDSYISEFGDTTSVI